MGNKSLSLAVLTNELLDRAVEELFTAPIFAKADEVEQVKRQISELELTAQGFDADVENCAARIAELGKDVGKLNLEHQDLAAYLTAVEDHEVDRIMAIPRVGKYANLPHTRREVLAIVKRILPEAPEHKARLDRMEFITLELEGGILHDIRTTEDAMRESQELAAKYRKEAADLMEYAKALEGELNAE